MITELPLILVVCDQEAVRDKVKRILNAAGHFALDGAGGRDCLRLAREREPAVMILDVRLPDLDGFEVCRRLKGDPATSSIATLLISAEGMNGEHKTAGLDCGADLYLTHPVSSKELISCVNALLRTHAAEHKARRLARQWQDTFEALSAGLALLDSLGTVRQCNSAMARLLGRALDNMAGENFCALLQESMGTDARQTWETVLPMNQRQTVEFSCGDQWYGLDFEPVTEPATQSLSVACILYCITHHKTIEENLRQANRMLVEADHRKNQILAMVAHELREPLAPIRYAQQIISQTAPKRGRIKRQQAIIDRQLGTMSRLLEDLLDITRIREGRLSLNQEILDLQPIVDQVVEALRPQFADRCHKLVHEPSSAPLWLEGDGVRLEQIVRNLLANAIKYTEPGGWIELRLEREDSPDSAAGAWAILRVRDSGIGIAPEMLPHIFDQFSQSDPTSEHTQGGLGIGLALVRSLAQMHGGQVLARSEGIGKGSEFILRLPLSAESRFPVTLPPCEEPPETAHAKKDERLKILIVDDNHDTVEALEELLHLWGYKVQGTHGGVEAIVGALAFQPDVILLDLGLPGINGHEVCRRLRQEPSLEGVLVIAVTGYGREEDRCMAQESGFNHLLVKPVDLAQLRKIIVQAAMLRE